jgi:hypothetical protein
MIENFNDWNINEAVTLSSHHYGSIISFVINKNKVDVFLKNGRHGKKLWFTINNSSKFEKTATASESFIIETIQKCLDYQADVSKKPKGGKPGTYEEAMLTSWMYSHNMLEIIESDPRLKKWWEISSRNNKFGI